MSGADDRDTDTVRLRLHAAGIVIDDDELAVATDLYRFYRAHVPLLYQPPEARYSEPALVFRAAPPLEDWTG